MSDSFAASPRHWTASLLGVATALVCGCGGGKDAVTTAPTAAPTTVANAQTMCAGLAGQVVGGATITSAKLVAAAGAVGERCVADGELPQNLKFEISMPTKWANRTVFFDAGGFEGTIFPAPLTGLTNSPNIRENGYVTIASQMGHDAATDIPGGSFALNPGMLDDYSFLAVPRVMAAAKPLMRMFYGDSPVASSKTVWEGCSGGGRNGLIQAQRYPNLFDGVIARAPAANFVPEFLYYQAVAKQFAQPGAALSQAKATAVANAVYAKCDALDGVADRIISKPQACNFDPAELACTGAETDSCLTPPQIATARTLYGSTNIANGRYVWPAFLPGGEDGNGGPYGWGNATLAKLNDGFIRFFVGQSASVDPIQLDPAAYTGRLDMLSSMLNAMNPDLSGFKSRGGKLILWHGLADWLITPNNTTAYYQSVVQQSGGQAQADDYVAYYTAPGVAHCFSGTGADVVDLVTPMFDWLEKGTKPSSSTIVATKGTVPPGTTQAVIAPGAITRPLCQYPTYPKYNGSGDPNVASSFTCTGP